MKIFITGKKGCGKSTLVKTIIDACCLETSGFETLPIYKDEERKGFYFHSLVPVSKNDIAFSVQKEDRNAPIPGVFNTLGVECLKRSQGERYIIMDEIGYLEHDENLYLQTLHRVIDENKNIIGVLRKCDIQYICNIRERKDIFLLDLDEQSFEQAKDAILNLIQEE